MFSKAMDQSVLPTQSSISPINPRINRRLSDMTLAEKLAKFKSAATKIALDEAYTAGVFNRESLSLKDKMQVSNVMEFGSVSSMFVQLFVREQAVEKAEKEGNETALTVS